MVDSQAVYMAQETGRLVLVVWKEGNELHVMHGQVNLQTAVGAGQDGLFFLFTLDPNVIQAVSIADVLHFSITWGDDVPIYHNEIPVLA